MARRRSPPRRGGSSDAARTLVTRRARDSGRAMPYAARQGGGKGTIQTGLEAVKDGCPNAGLGVVGGKGLRKPLIPCPAPGGDQARMPGSSRKPAAKRKGSLPHRKTTTVTPGGWGEATGQRQKKKSCTQKRTDEESRERNEISRLRGKLRAKGQTTGETEEGRKGSEDKKE